MMETDFFYGPLHVREGHRARDTSIFVALAFSGKGVAVREPSSSVNIKRVKGPKAQDRALATESDLFLRPHKRPGGRDWAWRRATAR